MFQTFDVTSNPDQAAPRVTQLRAQMSELGLDGFLVPRADAHQGEYVAPCDERLAWMTGFTGSAGFAAILDDCAALFVDGRYTVQAQQQCDRDLFSIVDWPATSLSDWLVAQSGTRIGFDPWLHTVAEVAQLRKALEAHGKQLVPTVNLVDRIWQDRPARPAAPVAAQPLALAGKTSDEKRAALADDLRRVDADAVVLTLPDSLCWLLNMRGSDIAHNPVVQAFAIVTAEGKVTLFDHADKYASVDLDPRIVIMPRADFGAHLHGLSGTVLIDPLSAPHAVVTMLGEGERVTIREGDDPCVMPKACKTDAEIEGARAAHLRDGAAMVEFLAWLEGEQPHTLTEIDVVKALEGFRADTGALREISFDTICGAGPNGAIVHYRVSEQSNRSLAAGELLLVDSGGQYQDGTTDITRTIALGEPDADARASFTAVLQGMIAVSTARFPKGVGGAHLDALARAPLWRMGRDYDHGTGHGVGSYLSVHEGPQRLSRTSTLPLEPGMILSNEPGYYREGAYGIRIENLIVVRHAAPIAGGDQRNLLDFETLTWVPIDRNLILADELAPWERDWLDAYHQCVWDKISPRVSDAAKEWLRQAVAPL